MPASPLSGKRVLLAVSGGIAAYKAAELLRIMQKRGAQVRVAMTPNATRFITPLTLATLSQHPVATDMFAERAEPEIEHVTLAHWADVMLVAPATANLLAKFAHGIADEMVSTLFLAVECPVVVAPAMHDSMLANPATQANLRLLRERGVVIVEPEQGYLASGDRGCGRLAGLDAIIAKVEEVLSRGRDLARYRVLITAGPTREPIDAVRFISNPSTGRMGYALAQVACERGAAVSLVSGPTELPGPEGVEVVRVTTAAEMGEAVAARAPQADVIIAAAAVLDYRPSNPSPVKVKKAEAPPAIAIEPTHDWLADLGQAKGSKVLVGFAAETENLLANAHAKCRAKGLDFIVANEVSKEGVGFASEDNEAVLVFADGREEPLARMSKMRLATIILDRIASLLKERNREP